MNTIGAWKMIGKYPAMIFAIILTLLITGYLRADSNSDFVGDPYYLANDPVSGAPLGEHPKIITHEGRQLRFAGDDTLAIFQKDPAPILAKLDEQLITEQLKHYVLQDCVISGEKLGGMGDPINKIFHNRLLRFCCSSCVKRAEKKFVEIKTKQDQSVIDSQLTKYPIKTCVVTGKSLDDRAINHVVGTRLVRLADQEALAQFNIDPAKYLARLDASH